MKTLLYLQKITFFSAIGLLVFFSACKQKDDTSAPSIDHVRPVHIDSVTNSSGVGVIVAIIGKHLSTTHKVYFNDMEADIRPTYITETSIIVTIPSNAPFKGASNQVKVVTRFGEATIPFTIIQPAPVITDFSPVAGSTGDTVTINGTVFDNADSVWVAGIQANIISVTPNQIKVKLPPGVISGLITVRTPGGKGKSANGFGFKYIIYHDSKNPFWYDYAYGSTEDAASTEKVRGGTNSIKIVYNGGGFGLGKWNDADIIDPTQLTAIKFSAYVVGNSTAQILFGVKNKAGNYDTFNTILDVKPGVWNDYSLNLKTDLHGVDILKEIQIQDHNNAVHPTIYFDEIGLY